MFLSTDSFVIFFLHFSHLVSLPALRRCFFDPKFLLTLIINISADSTSQITPRNSQKYSSISLRTRIERKNLISHFPPAHKSYSQTNTDS